MLSPRQSPDFPPLRLVEVFSYQQDEDKLHFSCFGFDGVVAQVLVSGDFAEDELPWIQAAAPDLWIELSPGV